MVVICLLNKLHFLDIKTVINVLGFVILKSHCTCINMLPMVILCTYIFVMAVNKQ